MPVENSVLYNCIDMSTRPEPHELLPTIKKIIGYSNCTKIDGKTEGKLYEAGEKVLSILKPAAKIDCESIKYYDAKTIKGERISIDSIRLGRLVTDLKKADQIVCFAVTIGQDVDDEIKRVQHISLYDAFLLHAAGAAAVDFFAEKIEDMFRRKAITEGYDMTARFSPGYCDWDLISGQNLIFDFLNTESIGLKRLKGGFMVPEKSITGIIIRGEGIRHRTACAYCPKASCIARREPFKVL